MRATKNNENIKPLNYSYYSNGKVLWNEMPMKSAYILFDGVYKMLTVCTTRPIIIIIIVFIQKKF